jgi:hypothetical protein
MEQVFRLRFELWTDKREPNHVALEAAVAFAGQRLLGHQQITDAYLLGLAIGRGGRLATLDTRMAALTDPKSAHHAALAIVD